MTAFTAHEVLRLAADAMEESGKLCTRVVIIAEVIDPDGDPSLLFLNEDERRPWAHLDLLRCATLRVEGRISRMLEKNDDDEADDE